MDTETTHAGTTITIKGICTKNAAAAADAARRHRDGATAYRYLAQDHAEKGESLESVATAARWSLESAATAMAILALTTGEMSPGNRKLIAGLARSAAAEASTAARIAERAFDEAYARSGMD